MEADPRRPRRVLNSRVVDGKHSHLAVTSTTPAPEGCRTRATWRPVWSCGPSDRVPAPFRRHRRPDLEERQTCVGPPRGRRGPRPPRGFWSNRSVRSTAPGWAILSATSLPRRCGESTTHFSPSSVFTRPVFARSGPAEGGAGAIVTSLAVSRPLKAACGVPSGPAPPGLDRPGRMFRSQCPSTAVDRLPVKDEEQKRAAASITPV